MVYHILLNGCIIVRDFNDLLTDVTCVVVLCAVDFEMNKTMLNKQSNFFNIYFRYTVVLQTLVPKAVAGLMKHAV